MHISDFDYELPEELIAQHPLDERDASRMLVVNREQKSWRDGYFSEFPSEVRAGDCIVINNTRVFPARLIGRREPSGGRIELLLVRQVDDEKHADGELYWEALARPARRIERGRWLSFGDGRLRAEVVDELESGRRIVRFECAGNDFNTLLDQFGQTPLPPYIKRDSESLFNEEDKERYQTIYAQQRGAIAAPTAGLHFTARVIEEIRARGANVAEITLHVGYGTFAPVQAEDLKHHRVASEAYEIDAEAADLINSTRSRGGRIIAIGTTTVRALESATDERGRVQTGAGQTSLTITPGYRFRAVDALLTNFHLPRSSLLVLVGAFAGRELTLAAYHHAVEARYRFYSYGDCMLIV